MHEPIGTVNTLLQLESDKEQSAFRPLKVMEEAEHAEATALNVSEESPEVSGDGFPTNGSGTNALVNAVSLRLDSKDIVQSRSWKKVISAASEAVAKRKRGSMDSMDSLFYQPMGDSEPPRPCRARTHHSSGPRHSTFLSEFI